MKLKEWLDIWLNKYTKFAVKLRTYERYKYIIEKHIIPKLGEFDLDDLSAVTLQDYVLSELESGNLISSKGLANNSVIGIVNVLKSALKLAKSLEISALDNSNKIKVETGEIRKILLVIKQNKLFRNYYLSLHWHKAW